MNIKENILEKLPAQVASMFRYWNDYMEQQVEFWPIEGDIDIHTESHCERVLLLALLIGERRRLKLRSMVALCHASIFHDTRRKDNFLDKGHGDRAADYYKAFCEEHDIKYLPEVYAAIKFHDRNDSDGEDYIRREAPHHSLASAEEKDKVDDTEGWLEVYRDFKDADALDRLRLGPWALDKRFLRTEEAKALLPFAQQLVELTTDPETLKATLDATRPYAHLFSKDD
jgi:hypothetical protein